jgi:hypothetical protein
MKKILEEENLKPLALRLYFFLAALESVLTLVYLLATPSDPKNSIFLGYSAQRLGMIGLALGVLLAHGFIARKLLTRQTEMKWFHRLTRNRVLIPVLVISAVFLIAGCLVLVALNERIPQDYLPYFNRVYPLIIWLSVLAFEVLVLFPIARFGIHLKTICKQKPALIAFAIALGIFLGIWILIAISGVGIVKDAMFWDDPGTPILLIQMLHGIGFGLAVFLSEILLRQWIRKKPGLEKYQRYLWVVDLLICLAIWYFAAQTWLNESLPRSYFAPAARPPNNEVYPYSDAADYDRNANMLLIGEGLGGKAIVPKPLYVLFLALLHAIGGPSYDAVTILQVIVLALFPVVLYLLGKSLHSRSAGLFAAIAAIAREQNAIALTLLIRVSHSKLLMSDFPTALAVAVLVLLIVIWFKSPERRRLYALAVGGCLGLVQFLRPQVIFLLPFILLGLWFVWKKNYRRIVEGAFLIGAGIIICITPWIIRNWQVTGKFALTSLSTVSEVNRRYSSGEGVDFGGDEERVYNSPLSAMLSQPVATMNFISAHFFHNVIQTVQILPLTFNIDYFDELPSYIKTRAPFWFGWDGSLIPQQKVWVFIHLLFMAVGIGAAWNLWRVSGIIPLLMYIAYTLSDAVGRNSGWRYILPVDWVGYFYLGIGIFQSIKWGLELFGESSHFPALPESAPTQQKSSFSIRRAIGLGIIIFLLGASMPIAERAIPRRYPMLFKESVLDLALQNGANQQINGSDLREFINDPNAVALLGRGLYPRFYPANKGEPGAGENAFTIREYSRLGFSLVGNRKYEVVLHATKSPAYFPDASDVIVIGCQGETVVDAALVIVLGETPSVYYRQPLGLLKCPLDSP